MSEFQKPLQATFAQEKFNQKMTQTSTDFTNLILENLRAIKLASDAYNESVNMIKNISDCRFLNQVSSMNESNSSIAIFNTNEVILSNKESQIGEGRLNMNVM